MLSHFSHVPLFATPWAVGCHGILQARILEWVATSFSEGSSWPRDQTSISCICRLIRYHWATREAQRVGIQTNGTILGNHITNQKTAWWSLRRYFTSQTKNLRSYFTRQKILEGKVKLAHENEHKNLFIKPCWGSLDKFPCFHLWLFSKDTVCLVLDITLDIPSFLIQWIFKLSPCIACLAGQNLVANSNGSHGRSLGLYVGGAAL